MQIQNVLKFSELRKDELTDVMKQYYEIKAKYPDFIVLFQVGSFFETYFEDAIEFSKTTGVTLTRKNLRCGKVLLAGVGLKGVKAHIEKLLNENYKVVLVKETGEKDEKNNLAVRKVANIYTKGCLIEREFLNPKENNYMAAIYEENSFCEFAYAEVSTGELYAAKGTFTEILSELSRISPKELLVFKNSKTSERLKNLYKCECLKERYFEGKEENRALNAIFNYSKFVLNDFLPDFEKIQEYKINKYLYMDFMTRKNLELVRNSYNNKKEGSIFWAADNCITPMGKRLLLKTILSPLCDIKEISERHIVIRNLIKNKNKFDNFSEILREIGDVSRISSKVSSKTVKPLELLALKESLKSLPEIEKLKKLVDKNNFLNLSKDTNSLQDYYYILDKTIEDDIEKVKAGNYIKKGANSELDALYDEIKNYYNQINEYEEHLKNTTGIKALKIKRKNGFYIEINSSHQNPAGDDFVVVQCLKSITKYTTPTLANLETKIYSNESKAEELKNNIIKNLKEYSKELTASIREYGKTVAFLDVLNSMKKTMDETSLVEPVIDNCSDILIKKALHPAAKIIFRNYEPLDINFKDKNIVILTGKNGIGKSVLLKTLGVMVVLIQAGFFVPAECAEIPLFDKLFTVLSASDDIISQKSTHQMQMSLVGNILKELTPNSLVVLDEIGKNTSYKDGAALFLGLIKYLSEETKAKIIASTHFLNMKDYIKFDKNLLYAELAFNNSKREITDGIAKTSDGIEAAKYESLPDKLINYSKEIFGVL